MNPPITKRSVKIEKYPPIKNKTNHKTPAIAFKIVKNIAIPWGGLDTPCFILLEYLIAWIRAIRKIIGNTIITPKIGRGLPAGCCATT